MAEEIDWPELLNHLGFDYKMRQIGDVVLAGLAGTAALVGGVPEALSLGIPYPVGEQKAEPVPDNPLVQGHVDAVIGGITSEAVEGHDERVPLDRFQRHHQYCGLFPVGVVDVVDLAPGSFGQADGPFQVGAFRIPVSCIRLISSIWREWFLPVSTTG